MNCQRQFKCSHPEYMLLIFISIQLTNCIGSITSEIFRALFSLSTVLRKSADLLLSIRVCKKEATYANVKFDKSNAHMWNPLAFDQGAIHKN